MVNLIISFLVATLMGLGVGGGGLFVIYLTLCLNYPQVLAQGTNLVFFILASLASAFVHIRKRKIRPLQLTIMVVFGILGSIVSAPLANFISPAYPRKCLGLLLLISGIITLYNTVIKKIFKKIKKTLYK
ncbi:MAG: sulfite exporter TauE/SafE family protein [Clostridia bacterium]|nr:sulfite exporter TauE/SafE family protein [Clostridia bacterium]